MDGENIPDDEIAAAVAVGASMLSTGTLYPASLWSGLADGVVSCYDYYPMMRCLASFFKFQTGGLETWMTRIPRTSVSFFFLSFIRPALIGACKKTTQI